MDFIAGLITGMLIIMVISTITMYQEYKKLKKDRDWWRREAIKSCAKLGEIKIKAEEISRRYKK